jgi:4-hydroxy-3-methylbut-2-enyl diphosphate reductase IspH
MEKIIYEPHPVSPERKAELRAQGLKIIDAVFKPADGVQEQAPRKGRQAKAVSDDN